MHQGRNVENQKKFHCLICQTWRLNLKIFWNFWKICLFCKIKNRKSKDKNHQKSKMLAPCHALHILYIVKIHWLILLVLKVFFVCILCLCIYVCVSVANIEETKYFYDERNFTPISLPIVQRLVGVPTVHNAENCLQSCSVSTVTSIKMDNTAIIVPSSARNIQSSISQ